MLESIHVSSIKNQASLMVMRVLVIVIGPVLMLMAVRRTRRRQLIGRVGVLAAKMARVIMAEPAILGHNVRYQQTLAVMPAALINIEVAFALGGALLLGQAVPLQVRGLFPQSRQLGPRQYAVARSFDHHTLIDVEQPVEAEPLFEPTDLG